MATHNSLGVAPPTTLADAGEALPRTGPADEENEQSKGSGLLTAAAAIDDGGCPTQMLAIQNCYYKTGELATPQ